MVPFLACCFTTDPPDPTPALRSKRKAGRRTGRRRRGPTPSSPARSRRSRSASTTAPLSWTGAFPDRQFRGTQQKLELAWLLTRGLHLSTFQLNLSALYGIRSARRGRVAHVEGVLRGV